MPVAYSWFLEPIMPSSGIQKCRSNYNLANGNPYPFDSASIGSTSLCTASDWASLESRILHDCILTPTEMFNVSQSRRSFYWLHHSWSIWWLMYNWLQTQLLNGTKVVEAYNEHAGKRLHLLLVQPWQMAPTAVDFSRPKTLTKNLVGSQLILYTTVLASKDGMIIILYW